MKKKYEMSWKDVEILAELLAIVVILIDLSGFVDEMKERLKRWLGLRGDISLKPFDCSFCMYHWTALVVMICLGRLNLAVYAAICFGCLLTTPAKGLFLLIIDVFNALFNLRWGKY